MEQSERSSQFGPAIFLGLCVYTVATAHPSGDYPNPALKMDIEEITDPAKAVQVAAMTEMLPPPARLMALVRPTPEELEPATTADPIAAIPPRDPLVAVLSDAPTRPDPAVFAALDGGVSAIKGASRPAVSGPAEMSLVDAPPAPHMQPAAPNYEQTPPHLRSVSGSGDLIPRPSGQWGALRSSAPKMLTSKSADAAPKINETVLVVIGENVHLRSEPTSRSDALGKLNAGTEGVYLDQDGNWLRIMFQQDDQPLTGWMYKTYLQPK